MSDRPPREQIAVRLSTADLAQVRRLAEAETDGNVSLMIRKLLTEALAARPQRTRCTASSSRPDGEA